MRFLIGFIIFNLLAILIYESLAVFAVGLITLASWQVPEFAQSIFLFWGDLPSHLIGLRFFMWLTALSGSMIVTFNIMNIGDF